VARSVSADGTIVVGNSSGRPFIYANGVMQDLGFAGQANAISGDGTTVVGVDVASGAFSYSGGVKHDLGLGSSDALAVSNNGSIIVGQYRATGGFHAFSYDGSVHDLGTLGGPSSAALGVSADGSVIVGYSDISTGGIRAFRHAGGTMTELPSLGGTHDEAYAVTPDGTVIVGLSGTQAAMWRDGEVIDLGTLASGSSAAALAISAAGTVFV
jgi:probable HAF family extracellular repeat protein